MPFPVALPLAIPMENGPASRIATAENLLVRHRSGRGTVGWGRAPSAPMMTGDTLGGLVARLRDPSRANAHRTRCARAAGAISALAAR